MPLFEVETDNHIIITWADDEPSATGVVQDAYPEEEVTRLTRRPRDTWVISKSALGLSQGNGDPCIPPETAWQRPRETKYRPSGSICTKQVRTWNVHEK